MGLIWGNENRWLLAIWAEEEIKPQVAVLLYFLRPIGETAVQSIKALSFQHHYPELKLMGSLAL